MRTTNSSRQDALAFLNNGPFAEASPQIIDSKTEEYAEGWIYFYQSARFIQSGDFEESLLGNAPVFVPRNDAPVSYISYHRPISVSMDAFRACGNAGAEASAQVKLFGWKPGAQKVSAVQAIRDHSPLGMAEAKSAVDTCLSGSPALITTVSVTAARELVLALSEICFVAEITYGP